MANNPTATLQAFIAADISSKIARAREVVKQARHCLKYDYPSNATDCIEVITLLDEIAAASLAAPALLELVAVMKQMREVLDNGLNEGDGVEINPYNYNHDDVCALNNGYVQLFLCVGQALAASEQFKTLGEV